jgi:hypothetical protein
MGAKGSAIGQRLGIATTRNCSEAYEGRDGVGVLRRGASQYGGAGRCVRGGL